MTTTPDPGARRAILEACDALREETVATLARLVRCPSTLGNEQSALNEMARIYEGLGLAPRRVPVDVAAMRDHPGFSPPLIAYEGRDCVVATHTPREVRGRSLALQGHVDVVPEGAAEEWTTPPFAPECAAGDVRPRRRRHEGRHRPPTAWPSRRCAWPVCNRRRPCRCSR
jgi:acetylornithine deacetylase